MSETSCHFSVRVRSRYLAVEIKSNLLPVELRFPESGGYVTKRWDLAACCPIANTQVRLVERKTCFISGAGTEREGGCCCCCAKSLQSCPTLWDPIDGSPPGSPVPGILQARTLEWVAISFSNAWKWKVTGKSLSCVRLLASPWTAAHQAPPSMGFSRQEYWSGVPLLSLGEGGHLSKSQLPEWQAGSKSFYRQREGATCRNSTVSSVILKLVTGGLPSIILIILGMVLPGSVCFHFLEAKSWNCDSLCHGYSPVIM